MPTLGCGECRHEMLTGTKFSLVYMLQDTEDTPGSDSYCVSVCLTHLANTPDTIFKDNRKDIIGIAYAIVMATTKLNPLCAAVYSPEITSNGRFGFITPEDMGLYLPKSLITIAFITNSESLPEC